MEDGAGRSGKRQALGQWWRICWRWQIGSAPSAAVRDRRSGSDRGAEEGGGGETWWRGRVLAQQ